MTEIVFNTSFVIMFLTIAWMLARLVSEAINGPRKYRFSFAQQFLIVAFSANVCIWLKVLA